MNQNPRRRRLLSLLTVIGLTASGAVTGLVLAPSAAADISRVANPAPSVVTADALPTTQIDGVAWSQAVVGNTVFVGGRFANARPAGAAPGTNLTARANLLAYDITTGNLVTSWAPSTDKQVLTVAASPDGSRIYIGGEFTSVNGTPRYRVAALDAKTGQLISSFNPIVSYKVNSIVATNSTVYLGGDFKTVNGVARNNLAAVSATNGALLGWNPGADAEVKAMVMAPLGDKLIVGGRFQNMIAGPAYGMAALNPVNGSMMTWNVGNTVRNAGSAAAITSLSTDGSKIYGTGYVFGAGGNLEGTFAADPATGDIKWVEDCHGDTYSAFGVNGTVYTTSHAHYCTPVGGFFQSDPWATNMRHSLAFTADATGTLAHNEIGGYYDWYGQPAPSMINWFPNWYTGTATGQGQAGWTVTGNDKYVVIGGEFPGLNGTSQQGLVRFAVPSLAPKKQGPRIASADFKPSVISFRAGSARIAIPANWDRDDKTLTYKVIRDGNKAAPIFTTTADSTFWERPTLVWNDNGLAPGSTHTYQVIVSDKDNNVVNGAVVSATVSATGTLGDYGQKVIDDGAGTFWRLNEPSGTSSIYDWAGGNDTTAGTGISRGAAGALLNSDNTASTFNGTANGTFASPTVSNGPDTFSTSAWFRTTSTSGGKIIGFGNAASGNSGSYDRHTYMQNDGRITFGVYPGGVRTVTSPKAYNDGQWHQVVSSMGPDGMSLYIDGIKVGSRGDTTTGQSYTGYWRVGGDNLGGWPGQPSSNFFAGDIDDVAVFPTALTPAKVEAQFAASGRQSPVPAAPADSYGAAVYADNPSSYWRLNDRSGTAAADASRSLNAGNYFGGYLQNQTGLLPGVDNAAVKFDGRSGQVVAANAVDNPTTYSEEAWFSTTTNRGGKILGFGSAASGTSSGYDRHVYMQDNGQLVFGTWTGQTNVVVTPKSYNDGQRHHVVATQGPDGMKLYVDGQLIGTNPQTGAQAYTGYWRVGGDTTWGSSSAFFDGVIDEAAFYPSVLAPQRVLAHFNAGGGNLAPTAAFTAAQNFLATKVDASGSSDPDGTVTSYAWDFGDGSTGTGATADHAYAQAGTYSVTLTVTDDKGATAATTQRVTATAPPPNQAPTAAAAVTVDKLTATVSGSGSTDSDGSIASYAWDFGDGAKATGPNASHTYAAAGSYTITLTVTDDKGATAQTTKGVSVTAPVNLAPAAAFTSSVSALRVDVDGNGSNDQDGTIASYAWDFGDGSTGAGATANHTYAQAGTFTVTLTVTDDKGATGTKTGEVTVTPAPNSPPTAAFTPTVSALKVAVDGTASKDSDGTISSYAWNFGDGTSGSGATTDHTYAQPGTYTVTLAVTDDKGATATTSTQVTVTSVLAADTFSRSTASGWGAAETGGNWTVSSNANFAVNGNFGTMKLATAGSSVVATLNGVSGKNVEISADVALDKLANGNGVAEQLISRRTSGGEYRLQALTYPSGRVEVSLRKVVNGAETVLATQTVPGLTVTAADTLSLKFQVTGDTPVLTGKVWKAGTAEPAATQVTFTDATSPLAGPGTVGLRGYLSGSATNVPVTIKVDRFQVVSK